MIVSIIPDAQGTEFLEAAEKGDTETVRVLLSDGRIDVNMKDDVSACKYDNMQGADGVDVCMCV